MDRRSLLSGIISALASPAIVRAESLMKIAAPKLIVPRATYLATTWTASFYDNHRNLIYFATESGVHCVDLGS